MPRHIFVGTTLPDCTDVQLSGVVDTLRELPALGEAPHETVITAVDNARPGRAMNLDRLALPASVVKSVSPASASAFVHALLEFASAADAFAASLQQADSPTAILTSAVTKHGQERMHEFAKKFDKTCEIAGR